MGIFNSIEYSRRIQDDRRLTVTVKIINYRRLAQRYADDVVHIINRQLLDGFKNVVGEESEVASVEPGRIEISGLLPPGMGFSDTHDAIERILSRLSSRAEAQGLVSLAALEVSAPPALGMHGVRVLKIPASEGSMHIGVARKILTSASNYRLAFSRQPIVHVNGKNDILYHECLARILISDTNYVLPPASFIPSIERAGLANSFDQRVVQSVIEDLSKNGDISLSCNISAQSTIESEWWISIFDQLKRQPDIAERLIIEIKESAPLVPQRARSFIQTLRGLGCKIAIDNFGVRYGVATGMEIKSPDIIKMDRSLLRNARSGTQGERHLFGLVTLARELADVVVVEGVDQQSDYDLVDVMKCDWVQGSLLGRATEPAAAL